MSKRNAAVSEQRKPKIRLVTQPEANFRNRTEDASAIKPVAGRRAQAGTDAEDHPHGSEVKQMDTNSLEARWSLEKWSVLRELWRAKVRMVMFYTSAQGKMSMEEAIARASEELGESALDEELERICNQDVDSISWYALDHIFRSNPDYAQQLWEDIKDQALADFKSGHFAAELFERTDWQKDVWQRAHFVVIFQEMVDEWKPRGAIELSMVEVLAVNYFLWRYWVMEHLQRAKSEPRTESYDYEKWRKNRKCSYTVNGVLEHRDYSGQYVDGAWDLPYQAEADAVMQAADLADKFRRAYQSELRTMREWRRYVVPVIINNPEQVNIAENGGQQVNVQGRKR
jgi:hypothetical protein